MPGPPPEPWAAGGSNRNHTDGNVYLIDCGGDEAETRYALVRWQDYSDDPHDPSILDASTGKMVGPENLACWTTLDGGEMIECAIVAHLHVCQFARLTLDTDDESV